MAQSERTPLRWQAAALSDYLSKNQRDYLLVAVPGAGKTFWALLVVRELLRARRIERLLVVVPTKHVKRQWASTAHRLGLNLESDYRNSDGAWPADADGVCMTYAQMFQQRALHRRNVARRPTLIVMDEVHHLQDAKGWGEAAGEAFDMAAYRILLSGTPWNRSGYIPWVAYNPDGTVQPSYEPYTYYDALTDKVCCDVFFPKLGGKTEWDFDGKRYRHTFEEQLSKVDSARRLATAIRVPESDYVLNAFREGDAELTRIRQEGLTRAGGLITARDIPHAEAIARMLTERVNVRPTLVTSDDRYAQQLLRNFTDSTDRWIVAVRMISEGVDIPRLRVLVWATNHVTRLYFQQQVGRVIRGKDGAAVVYLPAHPELLAYAAEVREMRLEALRRDEEAEDNRTDGGRERVSRYCPIDGQLSLDGAVYLDGSVQQDELSRADDEIRRAGGISTTGQRVLVARILRNVNLQAYAVNQHGEAERTDLPPMTPDSPLLSERKDALRSLINRIIRAWHYQTGTDFREAHNDMNRAMQDKVFSLRQCTEEQLERRLAWVQEHYQ